MSQKFVTFEIAKVLKEAGYPQECDRYCSVPPKYQDIGRKIAQPTYIEAWLWLWQVKKIYIDINCIQCSEYNTEVSIWHEYGEYQYNDKFTNPVDAIVSAINYLVENNLISNKK